MNAIGLVKEYVIALQPLKIFQPLWVCCA